MKTGSLATRFRHTFIKTIAMSIIASILTIALFSLLFVFSLNKDIYPANYYEQQISGIASYVRERNEALLSASSQKALESTMKGDGILYQVVDADGNILYGTLDNPPYKTKEELFNSFLNTTLLRNGYYIQTVPIEQDNKTKGAVLLAYTVKTTFINARGRVIFAFFIISLLSPFLYIIGFTLWFSKRFAQEINQPLQLLSDASRKIKNKDLDFTIDYHADNELGKLCDAFSEMQEELKKSLSAQWKMEQDRIEMVAALAHDLKSPLSLILAYSDALVEDNQDGSEELKQYLAVIRENAEKSATLVGRMQYTSELENMGVELHPITVNFPEFLEQKVQTYQLQAQQKSVELALTIKENVPNCIQIDTERLTRILDNLISNSLQYTPARGRIEIQVKTEDDQLCYTVSDTGSGFSAKDLKKAFDRFYRGDDARPINGGHSGLGLYIVKQLVEQLGGTVKIENVPTGGACVTFRHKLLPSSNNGR